MGKRTPGKLTAFILIVIINNALLVYSTSHNTINQQTVSISLQQTDLVPREKININSNNEFKEFPGSGTEEDPYIISGFEISAPISEDYNLINIASTDVFFIIENNFLTGNDQNSGSGISITSAANGLIRNNEIRDNTNWGIFIAGSEKIIVEYNIVISNMHQGVEILDGANNEIRHNTIGANGVHGIASYFSTHNIIWNNTVFSNPSNGIHIEEGTFHTVIGNQILFQNQAGIWLGGALNNQLISNFISENSVGIVLRDQTQIGNNPSDNNLIYDNAIFVHDRGIEIERGHSNLVSKNVISENQGNGINLQGGQNNSIFFNIISNSYNGLKITGSALEDKVKCNIFNSNQEYGVITESDTQFESISRNDFIKNQNTPQASDYGFSNTYESNYWDEVAHQDFKNDGINDFEYMLDGNTGSKDFSPSTKQIVDETVEIDVGCELDPLNNPKELQNLTSQLELEPRLELPISRFTILSFTFVILVGIVVLIFFRRKIIK